MYKYSIKQNDYCIAVGSGKKHAVEIVKRIVSFDGATDVVWSKDYRIKCNCKINGVPTEFKIEKEV